MTSITTPTNIPISIPSNKQAINVPHRGIQSISVIIGTRFIYKIENKDKFNIYC